MRTVQVAAVIAIAVGGAWWLSDRSDALPPTEMGQALAQVTMPATLSPEARAGQQAFSANCASCHGTDTEGKAGIAPPLIHKIYEPSHHSDMAFVMGARNGVRPHHCPFGNMAPSGVTDAELAGIIRFVREIQVANGIM